MGGMCILDKGKHLELVRCQRYKEHQDYPLTAEVVPVFHDTKQAKEKGWAIISTEVAYCPTCATKIKERENEQPEI